MEFRRRLLAAAVHPIVEEHEAKEEAEWIGETGDRRPNRGVAGQEAFLAPSPLAAAAAGRVNNNPAARGRAELWAAPASLLCMNSPR